MSKATISLTETSTDERVVFVWQNISHFYKLADQNGTRIELMSKCQIHVYETVAEVEQAIEIAAHGIGGRL